MTRIMKRFKKEYLLIMMIPVSIISGVIHLINYNSDLVFKDYIIEGNSLKIAFPARPQFTENKTANSLVDSYSYFARYKNNLFILTAANYQYFPQTSFLYQNIIAEYQNKFNADIKQIKTFEYKNCLGKKVKYQTDTVRIDMKTLLWGDIMYTWCVVSSGLHSDNIDNFLNSFEILKK